MKKKELNDLHKARQHFMKATTEWIIGTGFALKGMKNLVSEGDARKVLSDCTKSFTARGLAFMMHLGDMLNQMEQNKPKKSRASRKRKRKIRVE